MMPMQSSARSLSVEEKLRLEGGAAFEERTQDWVTTREELAAADKAHFPRLVSFGDVSELVIRHRMFCTVCLRNMLLSRFRYRVP